jgi:hypothetical protein
MANKLSQPEFFLTYQPTIGGTRGNRTKQFEAKDEDEASRAYLESKGFLEDDINTLMNIEGIREDFNVLGKLPKNPRRCTFETPFYPKENNKSFHQLQNPKIPPQAWDKLSPELKTRYESFMKESKERRPENVSEGRVSYPKARDAAAHHGQDTAAYTGPVDSCHTFPSKVLDSILIQCLVHVAGMENGTHKNNVEIAVKEYISSFSNSRSQAVEWFNTFKSLTREDNGNAMRDYNMLRGGIANGLKNTRMGDAGINRTIGAHLDLPQNKIKRYLTRSMKMYTSSRYAAEQLLSIDGVVRAGVVDGVSWRGWLIASPGKSSSIAEATNTGILHSGDYTVSMAARKYKPY